jgi:hypothetical protein
LAERHEIREGGLLQPGAAGDELGAEIAEVRDRPAERSQPQLEKRPQHLGPRALGLLVHCRSSRIRRVADASTEQPLLLSVGYRWKIPVAVVEE